MFERFTDRARRCVVLAQEHARQMNHTYIGTEHLLLGLIEEGDGVAARALNACDVALEDVRGYVEKVVGVGASPPTGHIPFTPRAKKVMEFSQREALQLGHNYIGTEHVLLGLLREGGGVGAQAVNHYSSIQDVRQSVIGILSGYVGPEKYPSDSDLIGQNRWLRDQNRQLMGKLEEIRAVLAGE